MFGGRGRVQVFIEKQYFVLGGISTFQKKKEIYLYAKEHTSYDQKLK